MKTKIIYISGDEIFSISDIRSAFDEVRNALNLGSDTVLFGVPVDKDDAGFGTKDTQPEIDTQKDIEQPQEIEIPEPIVETEIIPEETVPEEPKPAVKKRKTNRKKVEEQTEIVEKTDEVIEPEDKVVPILSILSSKESDEIVEEVAPTETEEPDIEIIEDEVSENVEEIVSEPEEDIEPEVLDSQLPETQPEEDADLEKLLSAITPLQEDFMEDNVKPEIQTPEAPEPENIDATLEQLATEFVASQDKIKQENKSSGRSKIGKLRNILPFKQSKNKDSQGLDNLFGWAGLAANDEDFSVPGFFTNAASKK